MVRKPLITQGYSLAEEVANSISHGIGLVFGIVGLVLLLVQAADTNASATAIIAALSGSCAPENSHAPTARTPTASSVPTAARRHTGDKAPERWRADCVACGRARVPA